MPDDRPWGYLGYVPRNSYYCVWCWNCFHLHGGMDVMANTFPDRIVSGIKVEGLWEIHACQVTGFHIECRDLCGQHLGVDGTLHIAVDCREIGLYEDKWLFTQDTVLTLPKPEEFLL